MPDSPASFDRLRRRDGAAWSDECLQHSPDLYGFIFRLLAGDQSVADDVLQEVWLEAMRRIGSFDPTRGAFRAWLIEIARRQVAGVWRKRSAHPPPAGLEFVSQADDRLLPLEVMEQLDRAALVRAALLALPPDRSAVLTARYLDDLPVMEIAAREKKSVKAIESLLTRARNDLRRLLGPYFQGPQDDHTQKHPAPKPAAELATSFPQIVMEKLP
jgi:RNA polymerase sigma-70 factor, ECF subfamily